jgi:hypothetical protein
MDTPLSAAIRKSGDDSAKSLEHQCYEHQLSNEEALTL